MAVGHPNLTRCEGILSFFFKMSLPSVLLSCSLYPDSDHSPHFAPHPGERSVKASGWKPMENSPIISSSILHRYSLCVAPDSQDISFPSTTEKICTSGPFSTSSSWFQDDVDDWAQSTHLVCFLEEGKLLWQVSFLCFSCSRIDRKVEVFPLIHPHLMNHVKEESITALGKHSKKIIF